MNKNFVEICVIFAEAPASWMNITDENENYCSHHDLMHSSINTSKIDVYINYCSIFTSNTFFTIFVLFFLFYLRLSFYTSRTFEDGTEARVVYVFASFDVDNEIESERDNEGLQQRSLWRKETRMKKKIQRENNIERAKNIKITHNTRVFVLTTRMIDDV